MADLIVVNHEKFITHSEPNMEESTNNAAVAIETKIAAPITWDLQKKFKIQDLRESHYEEVITLMKVDTH